VITEDEVMLLLERADPVRTRGAVPGTAAAGYVDAVRTRRMIVTLIDTEPRNTEPSRRWPIIIVTAAAVVAIVVGALVLAARDNTVETHVPAAPLTVAPSTTTPTTAAAAAPAEVLSPLTDIKDRMTEGSEAVLFVVSSPTPSYWRVVALSEFDGTNWLLADTELDDASGPLPQGFEPSVDGETVTQTFEITGLEGNFLPSAFSPVRVDSADGIRFVAETSSLLTVSGSSDGLSYTVESSLPHYDVARLRAAEAPPTGDIAERYIALPADFPTEMAELAREVTAGATTRYDRAIALQNWFRNFTYDLSGDTGHSQTAMQEFLDQRRGYCEQFAATYAAFARVLGLPSRVAIGFTPGELHADGRYHVQAKHAHSWPEIYFDGVGWVPFEPTPGRANPLTEHFTAAAATQDNGGG
jgi:transglutaminase superfamily protein/transglutaminase TgpA-like protein